MSSERLGAGLKALRLLLEPFDLLLLRIDVPQALLDGDDLAAHYMRRASSSRSWVLVSIGGRRGS